MRELSSCLIGISSSLIDFSLNMKVLDMCDGKLLSDTLKLISDRVTFEMSKMGVSDISKEPALAERLF